MSFTDIINNNSNDLAFIVGNGINRYPNNPSAISWDDLLVKLWQKFAPDIFNRVPKGMTITEFYDLLDLANDNESTSNFQIQKEASSLLGNWPFASHHKIFMEKARELEIPVLTTNFDSVLPDSLALHQYYTDTKGFSDFYPWTTYYGDRQLELPTDGFGVWYINGLTRYPRSIRLGLSHYMGSVERARNLIHKGQEGKLFAGKDVNNWRGCKTWLHLIFNKSLCIFGLGMDENETFIRWLLIERARYFKKFPNRRKKGWYILPKVSEPDEFNLGKRYFLETIGFELIEAENFEDIYQTPWL
ncbi:hypothetical protein [Sphingobacterium sp. MYb388]|uniref:hypothetical protein n=1 Tax=Sphingobacterium sp. MYb388 TaxID=2745437 RepID=UPI0030A61A7E